jgi:glycosyltransferase involved in cell wall biosynthesis
MSRILFDARAVAEKNGGVSRVAERMLAHLRATRPDAEIVTMTTGVDRAAASDLHLRLPNKFWSLACLLGLTSLDRVATRMTGRSFDELILPNIGFVGIPKIPYTIVVHDLSFLIEPAWFPWKMRVWHRAVRASRLISHATNIWCVSQTTARDVERLLGVEKHKISVLPSNIVTGALEPNPVPTAPVAPPYVLAFDGSSRKNTSTATAAVNRVREDERLRDLKLIVIGGNNRPSDEELDRLYAGAAALLYPSWYEGFGLPLHEAARFGVPILASAHGALPETAPPGSLLINPSKPHLWVSALRSVLESRFVKQ